MISCQCLDSYLLGFTVLFRFVTQPPTRSWRDSTIFRPNRKHGLNANVESYFINGDPTGTRTPFTR